MIDSLDEWMQRERAAVDAILDAARADMQPLFDAMADEAQAIKNLLQGGESENDKRMTDRPKTQGK